LKSDENILTNSYPELILAVCCITCL